MQVLSGQAIPPQPPCPCPSLPDLKAAEVAERSQVTLGTPPLVCAVAFSTGQERSVHFGVEGLPAAAMGKAAGEWVAGSLGGWGGVGLVGGLD